QNRIKLGLERDDLFTVVHEQVMTDTAQYADLLLPATTFLEHYDVAKGYGAYHFHVVQPVIEPVGEARSNQELFRELSVRLDLVPPSASDELGDPGALMELADRLPEQLAERLRSGEVSLGPAEGSPIQFVDVMPKTADRRVHLFPTDVDATAGLYSYQP